VALERLGPRQAVELAAYAEARGFTGTLATDHFQPWLPQHGQSPFVWSVLSAIGERTTSNFGPGMSVPGYRYHPATMAQAAATLATMYPGRHWFGVGHGEALNEHVVAGYWPEARERISRMFEAIELIKKLFAASLAGREVTFAGEHYRMESARLWTMPSVPPPLLVATSGPGTAQRAGKVADGIVTIGTSVDRAATVLQRFDHGAKSVGRDPAAALKVVHLHLSWAESDKLALANAVEYWPIAAMPFTKGDIRSPRVFEQMARHLDPAAFDQRLTISADPDVHRARIQKFIDLGFDRIYLDNVGPNQREWIDRFGVDVLPALSGR
jgi:G6PDH family F420-dependent oxidoreductase